jgi:hypothetical protein
VRKYGQGGDAADEDNYPKAKEDQTSAEDDCAQY